MRTNAMRYFLASKKAVLVAGALSGLMAAGAAQAGGFSGYAGVAGGFSASQRECHGAPEDACDRVAFGHKIFGGWNVTPNVAAEINYFYFGGVNTIYEAARDPKVAKVRESARAMTLGINWSVEIFQIATNNIRVGLARTNKLQDVTLQAGGSQHLSEYATAPYLGLGLSMGMNQNVRLSMGYDYIIDGHDSRHLFSIGIAGEY
jgi:hypothetical protein